EALMIGDAAPGDVESRAVIYTGADDRQPEGNVDRFAESHAFDGDQTLIVITGRDRVELAARRPHKQGVSREGTTDFNVVKITTRFNGRSDLARFFGTE